MKKDETKGYKTNGIYLQRTHQEVPLFVDAKECTHSAYIMCPRTESITTLSSVEESNNAK
jgi:hypothetical protein